jgi:hypothetical protein
MTSGVWIFEAKTARQADERLFLAQKNTPFRILHASTAIGMSIA